MEKVMEGVQNVLIYIDDVIIHTKDHPSHLKTLEVTLQRLSEHGLKLNLDKCVFGNREVAYLGFTLTPKGILPGRDKIEVLKELPEPTSLREVRGFIGLCNFFRAHVKNFARLSSPLTKLTREDSGYESGPLPADAKRAFQRLKDLLISEPCLAFPRSDRPYGLVTEAYPPTEEQPGVLSSALCQFDAQNHCQVLAYASRQLQDHESRYPPFLLEMAAANEGMEQFHQYLHGRSFVLFMDQRPEAELSHLHQKTLARFADNMDKYSFAIQPKTHTILPPFLRTASPVQIGVMDAQNPTFARCQEQDPDLQDWRHFRSTGNWPSSCTAQRRDRLQAMDPMLYEDAKGIVWVQLPNQTALFLPSSGRQRYLCQFFRDSAVRKQQEVMDGLTSKGYAWPGMSQDAQLHLQQCDLCKETDKAYITPNQSVAMEILGPFPSYSPLKFLMVMYDPSTGIAEFSPINNKDADQVAFAIFNQWISKFGLPKQMSTPFQEDYTKAIGQALATYVGDQNLLFAKTDQLQMPSPLYLAITKVVQGAQLSWVDYIPALQFAYNTSYNSKLGDIPFKLLFGHSPNPIKVQQRSNADDFVHLKTNIYLETKKLFEYDDQQQQAQAPNQEGFQIDQEVTYWEKSFGVTSWKGPVRIIQVRPHKVQVDLGNGKTRWLVNQRVSHNNGILQKGEVAMTTTPPTSEPQLINLIRHRALQHQAGLQLIKDLKGPQAQPINCNLISAISTEDAATQDHIRGLAHRIFNSPLPPSEVLTPQELLTWSKYPVSEINDWLFGHPLLQPEWRPHLCEFDEDTGKALPPGPAPPVIPAPLMVAAPQPLQAPAPTSTPKPSQRNKSFLKSFRSFSSKTKKQICNRVKATLDGNNNSVASGGTSTFYRGLDPVELEFAF
jgi:hypothetical protein